GITTESEYIGNFYQGGVIIYVNISTGNGLVCAVSDQSTGIFWNNGSYISTGAINTAIGAGQANTTTIITVQGPGTYAALACDNLSTNGYSDWFLPSKDELNLIYQNRSIINSTSIANGGSSLSNVYWSSSETHSNLSWMQGFVTGGSAMANKDTNYRIRAIRAF
ncbi:MAG: DUF1566 domain-containing protein, partial [Bacteroidales bacterium]|nr:DUF1566 domain-containing protein [Bacteroidales bacterium]